MSVRFRFSKANESDRDYVESLRREALRPHVERLTPWDEAKQARLFARTFDSSDTRLIVIQARRVGCVAVKAGHGWGCPQIAMFYIDAANRGKGLGTAVLEALLAEHDALGMVTRLAVLHGSPAENLYLRHGYGMFGADKWQGLYVRHPKPLAETLDQAA
jgi:GNAT superfamily N-acetyltransferase